MQNIVELRDELVKVYEQLRNGELGTDEVKQAANVAGKIMASIKVQIEYNKMVQSKRRIEFVEC